jgi:hypothetical protein
MTAKYLKDGRRWDVGVIVALQIETGSKGTIAALFSNTEDRGNDLRWNVIPDVVWSPWLIPKTS